MTEYVTLGNLVDALLIRLPLALNSLDVDWEMKITVDSIPKLQIRALIPKHRPTEFVEMTCFARGESIEVLSHLADHITYKFKEGVKKRYIVND